MNRSTLTRLLTVVLALGLSGTLTSCKDALDPKVYGDLTPKTFFSSEADFRSALVALYAPFSTNWGNTDLGVGVWYAALYNADPKTYWAKSETTTDEMYTPWYANDVNFTWGPATFNNDATYTKIRYVARATDIIDKIENSTADVPEAVKNQYWGEAKALRGWMLYILYDFFGPVNAKLDPATLSDTEITPRPSRADFVTAIEKDLTDAIPNLTDRYNGDAANWGRISKGAARMVLLRLYMHEKDWADAETVATDITQMGYSLMPSYSQICDARNNELIYAVPANASSPNWYWMETTPSDFGSAPNVTHDPGWYGYWMPWSFYDNFDPTDARLTTVLGSYTTQGGSTKDQSSGMPGAFPVKCMGDLGGSSGASIDWPVFRYAETLLSLAEAINEQRGPAEAYQYVNQVRERANLPDWSGLTQDQMRDSLLVERGRELYAEGVRRDDLLRHGMYISSAIARGTDAEPRDTIFPIPLDVIDQSDGVIAQNPGY